MSIIKAIFYFILSLFGFKPKVQPIDSSGKYHNEEDIEAGSLGGESSKNEEDQELENKYGIWAFLKRIIDLVEQKFSQVDKEEVKNVGRSLNNLGAKFLGEIKVGKSARSMGIAQGVQQQVSKGKQQSR
jgi:hypothetical protein